MSTATTAAPPRDNLIRALPGSVGFRSSSASGALGILYGTLVPYLEWAEIRSTYEGHFMECFGRSAFAKSIKENGHKLKPLYEHGLDPQIARKPLGRIVSLADLSDGVDYEVELLDTSYNRDLLPAAEAGLLGSSVRFRSIREDFERRPRASEFNPHGIPERIVREAAMVEFGPCPFPTYDGATAGAREGMRSLTDQWLRATILDPAPAPERERIVFAAEWDGDSDYAAELRERHGVWHDFPAQDTRVGPDAARAADLADELRLEDADEEEARSVGGRGYARLVQYVSTTPWMIHQDALNVIVSVIAERAAGERLSDEEIAARIGGGNDLRELVAETNGVAVIPVAGPIVPHGDMFTRMSGLASVEGMRLAFNAALESADVKAIVFNMDTPGGAVDLIPEFADEIRAARGTKPIVAVANTWAASAGYYLAAQADEVVATRSGWVGSVGVVAAHQDMSKALADKGVKTTLVTSAKYKAERDPSQPLSPEARDHMQETVDRLHKDFVQAVADGRGTTAADVQKNFGQGRLVDAQAALEAGMIDRIATLEEVVAELGGDPAETEPDQPDATDLPDSAPGQSPTREPDAGAGAGPHSLEQHDGAGAELHSETRSGHDADSPTAEERNEVMSVTETERMTLEDLNARQEQIRQRLMEIQGEHPAGVLPPQLQEEWDSLVEERDGRNKPAIKAAQMRMAAIAEYADEPERRVDAVAPADRTLTRTDGDSRFADRRFQVRASNLPANIYDITEYRSRAASLDELPGMYRDGAMFAIERAHFPHPSAQRSRIEAHLERLLTHDSKDASVARRILMTGSDAYDRAYGKSMMNRALTADEQRTLAAFGASEDGGFAVPFTLDPTMILTTDGAINPLRTISRNIQLASGNTWKGITTSGVVASYDPELTETDDDSPTIGQPEATVEKAQAFVPFSIEIDQDWPSLRTELARLFQEAKDELESDKFVNGAGSASNEPEGILTGTTYHVSTSGSNALTVPEDLSAVMGSLGPRFRARAVWLANLFLFNTIRASDDTGTLYTRLTEGVPAMLMGQAAYESSELAASLTADGAELAVYGDFSKFAIIDKVGLNTELIPHVFGTARNFPTGERGIYAYWRNTSKVLVDNAFRVLTVKS